MGRRKLEMKKIENLEARRVCFTKRRQGLFKKAAKLSKDHNVKILSIVFSTAGKPFVFSSGGNHPSISFDSMLQNLLLNGSSSSSSSHPDPDPVVENDFEHCSTSSSVDEATIDLEGTLNVEEEEEETRVSSLEGISDSSFQFGDEIQPPLSDFERIENPNLLSTNFELGGFEDLTPIDLEGIWDSSFQFSDETENPNLLCTNFESGGGFEEQTLIDLEGISDSSFQFGDEIQQHLSDFEIENPNFETNGFEEQMSSSFLDVEDYSMEEIWRSL